MHVRQGLQGTKAHNALATCCLVWDGPGPLRHGGGIRRRRQLISAGYVTLEASSRRGIGDDSEVFPQSHDSSYGA
jgi:hypothetical protein